MKKNPSTCAQGSAVLLNILRSNSAASADISSSAVQYERTMGEATKCHIRVPGSGACAPESTGQVTSVRKRVVLVLRKAAVHRVAFSIAALCTGAFVTAQVRCHVRHGLLHRRACPHRRERLRSPVWRATGSTVNMTTPRSSKMVIRSMQLHTPWIPTASLAASAFAARRRTSRNIAANVCLQSVRGQLHEQHQQDAHPRKHLMTDTPSPAWAAPFIIRPPLPHWPAEQSSAAGSRPPRRPADRH